MYTAMAPLIRIDVPEIESIARTVIREYLLTVDTDSYYRQIRFADPALLDIFDFSYVAGTDKALTDPTGLLLTTTAARALFGAPPYLGRSITLDHGVALHVTAIIEELPKNTHFNSSFIQDEGFGIVAPLAALDRAEGYDLAGNFGDMSTGNLTYILIPPNRNRSWLQAMVDGAYASHFPEEGRDLITGFKVRPIVEANTIIWDMLGIPVIGSVQLLAILVLIVAIINYANLATAQSLGRTREVGLRKTLGASRYQLLCQFLTESVTIAVMAMLLSLALLEGLVPLFNTAIGRAVTTDYVATLPWLATTAIAVGILSGAYPAYVIARATPMDALRDGTTVGIRRSRFRSALLGLQFVISIFMLAMVLIVYFQNDKIVGASSIYSRSQVLTLNRIETRDIQQRHQTLKNEISRITSVEGYTYSSQVPFEQDNDAFLAGREASEQAGSFPLMVVWIDEDFLDTYQIPILAGRNLSDDTDAIRWDGGIPNVIVNQATLEKFGFEDPGTAIGQTFYQFRGDRPPRPITIAGVVPSQNFQGFHNQIKPIVFIIEPSKYRVASIRLAATELDRALTDIEAVWEKVVPEYPIQTQFLNETFDETYSIFRVMNQVLAGFALVALILSMIGLFGLAAFVSASMTREIGLRKVMGANTRQVVGLLIWQFSKPVFWASVVALPLAWFASGVYLDFFADRLAIAELVIVAAGLSAIVFSLGVVTIHAYRIGRTNPIHALRYE